MKETKVFKGLFVPINPAISAFRLLKILTPRKPIIAVKIIHKTIFIKDGFSIICCIAGSVCFSIIANFASSVFPKNTGLKYSNCSDKAAI